jgi:hypothetical protein
MSYTQNAAFYPKKWEIMFDYYLFFLTVTCKVMFKTVLRIRIHRIHMFLGLPDPDPLVRGMDPDPSIMQKY